MFKRILKNIAVISFSTILALVAFVIAGEFYIRSKPRLYSIGYVPSKNERLVYELQRGIRPTRSIIEGRISSQGMYDRYYPVKKPENTSRIAIVGDSSLFGLFVKFEESFCKVLEKMLNRELPGRNIEVINFCVPGYNTAQEYELIVSKVLKFSPDIVLLAGCGNDVCVCNFLKSQKHPTFANCFFRKSFLYHFFVSQYDAYVMNNYQTMKTKSLESWWRFKRKELKLYYPDLIVFPTPGLEEVPMIDDNPPGKRSEVPEKYWYMLGYENYEHYLRLIRDLLEEEGIPFISFGFFTSSQLEINEKLDIDLTVDFFYEVKKKGIIFQNLTCMPVDAHMNSKGHHIAAEVAARVIKGTLVKDN